MVKVRFVITALLCIGSLLASKERSIGILTNLHWRGEHSLALRLQSAGKNLGWKVTLLDSKDATYPSQEFDWILTLTPDGLAKIKSFHAPNYLVLFDPVNHFFDAVFCLSNRFASYDGYLKTFEEPILLKEQQGQRFYPIAWYPTAQLRPYKKVLPRKLFYFVGQWGNRCNDKYQKLEALLSQKEYMWFFGNPNHGAKYKNAYKGEIPYGSESIQNQIFELGVCLVLHSDIHIAHRIPSGRIFEAAAAASVIISDMNPFVQKYFGDSVLYIDHTKSGEEMFAQINSHMQWILTHEEEAQLMAKRSYEVFRHKFLLEEQLIHFDEWQQTVLSLSSSEK